jgi:hypothetical protein
VSGAVAIATVAGAANPGGETPAGLVGRLAVGRRPAANRVSDSLPTPASGAPFGFTLRARAIR